MAADEIRAARFELRVAYDKTVELTVYDTVRGVRQVFEDLADTAWEVWVRARLAGATEYAVQEKLDKVSGQDGTVRGVIPAWEAAAVGQTYILLFVLRNTDLASEGDTLTGDFEEVLGEITRTIGPAVAP